MSTSMFLIMVLAVLIVVLLVIVYRRKWEQKVVARRIENMKKILNEAVMRDTLLGLGCNLPEKAVFQYRDENFYVPLGQRLAVFLGQGLFSIPKQRR